MKAITINPEFLGKRTKTQKKSPSGKELKKALLQSLSSPGIIEELTQPVCEPNKPTESAPKIEAKPASNYGCLKHGSLPTLREFKRTSTTIKQYASFGKGKSNTVRVLLKDRKTYAKIEKEKTKIDERSMPEIRNYLRERKLYKIGSTAPDDVLRDIYKNAILTGNVENNNSDTLVHNFLNEPG